MGGKYSRVNWESRIGSILGFVAFSIFIYADVNVFMYPTKVTFLRVVVACVFMGYFILSSEVFKFSDSTLSKLYFVCIATTLAFTDLLYYILITESPSHIDRAIQVGMTIIVGTSLLAGNARKWVDQILFVNLILFVMMMVLLVGLTSETFFTFFNFIFFTIMTIIFNKSYKAAKESDQMSRKLLEEKLIDVEYELTEKIKLQNQLTRLATFDEMTGLLNRRSGLGLLDSLNAFDNGCKTNVSVCYFDLDSLKMVNDTFGHSVGDEYIKDFAFAMKTSVRSSDITVRLGGDEFLLVLVDVTYDKALEIVKKIEESALTINLQKERVFKMSVSYGMTHNQEGIFESIKDMMEVADERMYEYKKNRHANTGDKKEY